MRRRIVFPLGVMESTMKAAIALAALLAFGSNAVANYGPVDPDLHSRAAP
jgi:hypothetical protein